MRERLNQRKAQGQQGKGQQLSEEERARREAEADQVGIRDGAE